MKLKEEDVPRTILPREKPEECTMKQLQRWFLCRRAKTTGKKTQLDTSRLWYSIQCQTRGVPEVICAERHTTTCMSRHIFEVAARLVSPNNPINVRALSLGPRLSLFSP